METHEFGSEEPPSEKLALTPRLQSVLRDARRIAGGCGMEVVGVEHLVLASLRDPDAVPTQVFRARGLPVRELERALVETMAEPSYRPLPGEKS